MCYAGLYCQSYGHCSLFFRWVVSSFSFHHREKRQGLVPSISFKRENRLDQTRSFPCFSHVLPVAQLYLIPTHTKSLFFFHFFFLSPFFYYSLTHSHSLTLTPPYIHHPPFAIHPYTHRHPHPHFHTYTQTYSHIHTYSLFISIPLLQLSNSTRHHSRTTLAPTLEPYSSHSRATPTPTLKLHSLPLSNHSRSSPTTTFSLTPTLFIFKLSPFLSPKTHILPPHTLFSIRPVRPHIQ